MDWSALLWRNISSNSNFDCSLRIEYETVLLVLPQTSHLFQLHRVVFRTILPPDCADRPHRDRDDRLGWCAISGGEFRPSLPAISQFRPRKSIYVPSVPVSRSCIASVGLFVPPNGNLTVLEYPRPDILVPDIVIRSNLLSVCFTCGTSSNRSSVCFVSWKLNILTRAINRFGRAVVSRYSRSTRDFLCEWPSQRSPNPI